MVEQLNFLRLLPFRMFRSGLFLLLPTLICLQNSGIAHAQGSQRDRYASLRNQMVNNYIAGEGVTNEQVLNVMRTVPRHEFVRPDLKGMAYYDQALDIGHKQTISPPFIVAYMTESLDPQPTDKVLEIGTGSGYQAAVLSGLVAEVYTIEIVEPLGKRAASVLQRLNYSNVHCRVGDGFQGWPEQAPFDKIIVTCSPENVPQPLVDQLKEGGKMIIPLGERYQQVFYLLEKKEGRLTHHRLIPTLFVPMTGKMEEMRQKKPDPAHPQLVNGGFEVDSDGDGFADHWHYQRRTQLVGGAFAGERCVALENTEPGRTAHLLQAMAIDGTQVRKLRISWAMRASDLNEGRSPSEAPGIALYFFDAQRLPIDRVFLGPWLSDEPDWSRNSEIIAVPPQAREAILQVGLDGGTGKLWLDEIQVQPAP